MGKGESNLLPEASNYTEVALNVIAMPANTPSDEWLKYPASEQHWPNRLETIGKDAIEVAREHQALAELQRKENIKNTTKLLGKWIAGVALGTTLAIGATLGAKKLWSYTDEDQWFDDKGYSLAGGAVGGFGEEIHPEYSETLLGSAELGINTLPKVSSNVTLKKATVFEDRQRQIVVDPALMDRVNCDAAKIEGAVPTDTKLIAWTDRPDTTKWSIRYEPATNEVVACFTPETGDAMGFDTTRRVVFDLVSPSELIKQ